MTYHLFTAHPILNAADIVADYHASLPHANIAPKHQTIKGHSANEVKQLMEYLLRIAVVQAEVLKLFVEMLQLPDQLLPGRTATVLR